MCFGQTKTACRPPVGQVCIVIAIKLCHILHIPYCFILAYSVVRPMPSSSAAKERLPPVCFSARIICFFSISTFFKD